MNSDFKLLSIFLVYILSSRIMAQPGSLDPSFNSNGRVITAVGTDKDEAYSVAVQKDGKIVVVGLTSNGGSSDFAIVRYNSNGTLDKSFSGDGKLSIDFANGDDVARAVAILPNGNILVAGYASVGGNYDFALAQVTPDGKLATTFSGDGKLTTDFNKLDDLAYAMFVTSDRIILVGSAIVTGIEEFGIVRYLLDGTLDTGFSQDGKTSIDIGLGPDYAYSVAIQADSKIVIAGYTGADFENDFAVARLNPDGTLDTGFSSDGKLTTDFGPYADRAYSIAIQSDQKIIVAGYTLTTPGNDFALARYLPDGTLDPKFNLTGKLIQPIGAYYDEGYAMIIQPDGKILVAGQAAQSGTDADFGLARFNEDGSLDKSFSADGKVFTPIGSGVSEDEAHAIAIQSDGKIILAGEASNGNNLDFAVARYISGITIATENKTPIVEHAIMYPNPIGHDITLDFELKHDEILSFDIYDIRGVEIKEVKRTKQFYAGKNRMAFSSPNDLAAAKYYLLIQAKGQRQQIEFLKSN